MHRLIDWEARLAAYLEPLRLRPFAWGAHDCVIFAAGAVEAMTGENPLPAVRGRYRTAIGAARALRRYGEGSLEASLAARFAEVPHPLAQRGDIVLSGGSLGIAWTGCLIAVGTLGAREGLIRVPRAQWIEPRAWRVPFAEA